MKKIFILITLLFLFNSCDESPINKKINEILAEKFIYGFDFTKYTEKGFLFTPLTYLGNYEAIGVFTVVFYPRYYKEDVQVPSDISVHGFIMKPVWKYQKLSYTEVLDSAYSVARELGADAIINLEILPATKFNMDAGINIEGIKVEGFAIKRK